jgi:hypothetical protein
MRYGCAGRCILTGVVKLGHLDRDVVSPLIALGL